MQEQRLKTAETLPPAHLEIAHKAISELIEKLSKRRDETKEKGEKYRLILENSDRKYLKGLDTLASQEIQEFELLHKELTYYLAGLKPWGRE